MLSGNQLQPPHDLTPAPALFFNFLQKLGKKAGAKQHESSCQSKEIFRHVEITCFLCHLLRLFPASCLQREHIHIGRLKLVQWMCGSTKISRPWSNLKRRAGMLVQVLPAIFSKNIFQLTQSFYFVYFIFFLIQIFFLTYLKKSI